MALRRRKPTIIPKPFNPPGTRRPSVDELWPRLISVVVSCWKLC